MIENSTERLTAAVLCKQCGSGRFVKNGLVRGHQRYRCQECGYNFTDTPPRGYPLQQKVLAVLLYLSGLSMRRTALLLGVSTPTVQEWIERMAGTLASKPEPQGRAIVIELDEMWHFVQKKNKLSIWKAYDRATGRLVDWECGSRDRNTAKRLIHRLRAWDARLYCADAYDVYTDLIPVGRLYQGKDHTHGVERTNAQQRHWLARFRRRTCVVSKAVRLQSGPDGRSVHGSVRTGLVRTGLRQWHAGRPSFYLTLTPSIIDETNSY